MKKLIVCIMMVLVGMMVFASPCFASDGIVYDFFKNVRLYIGEKDAEVNYQPATMEQPAFEKNGRTLVPFRFLGESLGAKISWIDQKQQAVLKLNSTEVIVTVGSKVAYVNGKMQTLDVPAEIKGGRTFVPLRFVSEAFGAYVNYDSEDQMVEVSYADTSNWKEYTMPSDFKYKLPADWEVTREQNDTVLIITSPRGSKLWLYWIEQTPEKVRQDLKQQAVSGGFEFVDETLDDPNDVNKGFLFGYNKTDPVGKKTYRYAVYVDPLSDIASHIAEMLLEESDDYFRMEMVILVEIVYS